MKECKNGRIATHELSELLSSRDLSMIDNKDTILHSIEVNGEDHELIFELLANIEPFGEHQDNHNAILIMIIWSLIGGCIFVGIKIYYRFIKKRTRAPETHELDNQNYEVPTDIDDTLI